MAGAAQKASFASGIAVQRGAPSLDRSDFRLPKPRRSRGHCRRPFTRRSAAVRARRRRRSCAVRSCAHHPRPQRFRRPTWRWFYISRIVAWLRVESRRSRVLCRGRRASRREVKRAQILADNVFYPLTYSDSLNLDDMTDQTQARFRTAEALGDRRPAGTERHAEFRLGALFGLGSPLPHLRRDSARCPHLRRDWAHPCPHLRRDWARRCHICAGTGLAPPTSAPGLGRVF